MAILYYGNGDVTIKGAEIRGVEIRYRGAVEIEKTANDNFAISHQNNGIIIFPINEGYLTDLFSYEGELKILSVIAADNNAESVTTAIKKVMDYAELISSNAEDMTIKSENLSAGFIHGKTVGRTSIKQKTINNQHTDKYGSFYLQDGIEYAGYFHIHLKDNSAMTGREHGEDSQDLYIKQVQDGEIIDKLIPTRSPSLKLPKLKKQPRRTTRRTPSGGYGGGSGGGY